MYIGFSGTALLRCNEGTFRVRKIYGDGNCTFRAISYILWRNEEEHQSLRAMVSPMININVIWSYKLWFSVRINIIRDKDRVTKSKIESPRDEIRSLMIEEPYVSFKRSLNVICYTSVDSSTYAVIDLRRCM